MKKTIKIEISKDELESLIRKEYNIIDGEISFLIKEETFKCGVDDIGNVYSTRNKFDGVKIIIYG